MESEEESQQEGVKPAAKNMSQQQKRGGRPRGRPPLGSAGREGPSHIARRTPRSRGRNLTVTEFAKQLQGEGQTGKTTKVLKLAGRALDPHVMSSSEGKDESDSNTNASETSDPSMATRSSVRSSNTEAASVLSRKRRGRPASNKASTGLATLVVEVDSLDSQSPGKRRKTTPEVKKGVTMLSASSRRQKVVGRSVNPHVMSGSEESGTTNTTDTESDATDTESDATDTLRRSPRKHSTATTQIRVSPRKHQKIAAAEEDEEEDAEYKQQRKVPGTRLKKSSNRVSETSGPSMATSSAHGSNTEAASVLSRKRRGRPASNKASTDLATLVVEVDSLDSQSSDKKRKVTQEEKKGVTHTMQSASSRKQKVVGSVVDLCMMSGSEESGTSDTTDTESDTTDTESDATDTESDATDTLRRSPRKHSTATTQIRVSPRKHQKIAAAEEDEEEDAEYKQQRKVPGTRSKESSSRTSETRAPSMAMRSSAHGSNMKAASVLSRRQRGRPASNKASTGLATQSSVQRSITPTEVEDGVTQIKRNASLRKQKVVGRVVNPHVMSSSEESDVSNATDTESNATDTESNAAATLRRSPRKHQGVVTAAAEEDEEEEAENKQQRKVVRTWSKESSNKVSKTSGPSMATRSSAHGSNTEADSALTRKRRARPSSNRASALVVEMDSDSHSSDKRRKVTQEEKKGVTHTRQSASSRKQKVVGRVVNPHVMSGSEESDARNATDTESDATDTLRRSPRKHSTATTQIRVSPRKHQRTAIARTEEDKEKPSHLRRGRLAGKHSAGKGERRKVTPEVRKRVTRVTAF